MMSPLLLFAALAAATPSSAPSSPAPVGEPAPADDSAPALPWRLALQSTSAFGITHARFFNQLASVRLDYRFGPRFAFGGALGYANLKGKEHRVHNALPELQSEYRAPLGSSGVSLPLRVSFGFLPKNGPTFRLAAGLNVPLSERFELELVPLEPMLWMTRDRPELSLNVSLALCAAF